MKIIFDSEEQKSKFIGCGCPGEFIDEANQLAYNMTGTDCSVLGCEACWSKYCEMEVADENHI